MKNIVDCFFCWDLEADTREGQSKAGAEVESLPICMIWEGFMEEEEGCRAVYLSWRCW